MKQSVPAKVSDNQTLDDGTILNLDRDVVYFVQSGGLDLFAVPGTVDAPTGARVHLGRMAAGLVFGFERKSGDAAISLIALASGRTILAAVDDLTGDDDGAAPAEEAARYIERWIRTLAPVVAGVAPPAHARRLSRAETLSVDAGSAVYSNDSILWVSPIGGRLEYFGEVAPRDGGLATPLPLAAGMWAASHGASEIRVQSTRDVLVAGAVLPGLQALHRLLMDRVRLGIEARNEAEALRLRRYAAFEDAKLSGAVGQFRAILNARGEAAATVAQAGEASLFDACMNVAAAMGITLEYPQVEDYQSLPVPRQIVAIAHASAIRARQVRLIGEWWKKGGDHFVAFEAATKRPVALVSRGTHYELVDPESGRRQTITASVAARLGEDAFTLYRTFGRSSVKLSDMLRLALHGNTKLIGRVLSIALGVALLSLITPVVTKQIFDSTIPNGRYGELAHYTFILLAILAVTTIAMISQNIHIQRARARINDTLQAALWDRLLKLPATFFRDYTAADLTARAFAVNRMFNGLTTNFFAGFIGGVLASVNLLIMFYFNWRLAIYAVFLTVLALAAGYLALASQIRYQRAFLDRQGALSGRVFQMLSGIAKLRVTGSEKRAFSEWAQDFLAQSNLNFRARSRTLFITTFTATCIPLTTILLFIAVSWFADQITVGDFLAFNVAFQQFFVGMMALITAGSIFAGIIPVYRRALPILRERLEEETLKIMPGHLSGRLSAENVSFRYSSDGPLILDNINVDIAAGEFVAICGPSGSGKSTLLRLLLGFEKAGTGTIKFDQHSLENLDIRAVRRQIGAVLQDSRLMPGDIFQNIVGTEDFTIEDAWEAARQAGIDEDIRKMPLQMQTNISEGGTTLSGGQRQRILIARALIKRPRYVMFDEATSALDNHTQAVVTRNLEQLKVTRIAVAHRLSTVVGADRILVMENGRIVQSGTYAELTREPGLFSKLAEWQLL